MTLVDGFNLQCYQRKSVPVRFEKCKSKLIFSFHRLAIETGRNNNTHRDKRNWFSCKGYDEEDF